MRLNGLILVFLLVAGILLMGCNTPSKPTVCADGIHKPGDSWKADDGCNTCICGEDGGIACTEMYCVPECEEKETQAEKDECWKERAVNESEASYCNNILDEGMKEECYTALEGEVTEEDCEGISEISEKEECWKNKAIEESDVFYCDKIASFGLKSECYTALGLDEPEPPTPPGVDECAQKAEQSEKDSCYKQKAIDAESEFFCGKIVDKTVKNSCYTALGLDVPEESPAPTAQEECEAKETQPEKDSCWKALGISENDEFYCWKISDEGIRTECLNSVS